MRMKATFICLAVLAASAPSARAKDTEGVSVPDIGASSRVNRDRQLYACINDNQVSYQEIGTASNAKSTQIACLAAASGGSLSTLANCMTPNPPPAPQDDQRALSCLRDFGYIKNCVPQKVCGNGWCKTICSTPKPKPVPGCKGPAPSCGKSMHAVCQPMEACSAYSCSSMSRWECVRDTSGCITGPNGSVACPEQLGQKGGAATNTATATSAAAKKQLAPVSFK